MSSNGNIFRLTVPLRAESIGHRRIPLTQASDAEFNVFFDLCMNKRAHNWYAGDERRHIAQYDVTVMVSQPRAYIWQSVKSCNVEFILGIIKIS